MKTLVGIIVGLLFVVAVAVFTTSPASAHNRFSGDANAVVGCVDDEVADTLIASGAFSTSPVVLCTEGHTSVVLIIPQGPGI